MSYLAAAVDGRVYELKLTSAKSIHAALQSEDGRLLEYVRSGSGDHLRRPKTTEHGWLNPMHVIRIWSSP